MHKLLSLCDLHYCVVVGILAIPMAFIVEERDPGFPPIIAIGAFGAVASGMVLVFGFLGLCPFELGFRRILAWCVVNFAAGAILAAVIFVCATAVAVFLRALFGAIF